MSRKDRFENYRAVFELLYKIRVPKGLHFCFTANWTKEIFQASLCKTFR